MMVLIVHCIRAECGEWCRGRLCVHLYIHIRRHVHSGFEVLANSTWLEKEGITESPMRPIAYPAAKPVDPHAILAPR